MGLPGRVAVHYSGLRAVGNEGATPDFRII